MMELNVRMCDCPETIAPYDLMDHADTKLDEMSIALRHVSRLTMGLDVYASDHGFNDKVFTEKCEELSILVDGLWEFYIPMIRGIVQGVIKLTESEG